MNHVLTLTIAAACAWYGLRARDLALALRVTERERDGLLKAALKRNEATFLSRLRAERVAFV